MANKLYTSNSSAIAIAPRTSALQVVGRVAPSQQRHPPLTEHGRSGGGDLEAIGRVSGVDPDHDRSHVAGGARREHTGPVRHELSPRLGMEVEERGERGGRQGSSGHDALIAAVDPLDLGDGEPCVTGERRALRDRRSDARGEQVAGSAALTGPAHTIGERRGHERTDGLVAARGGKLGRDRSARADGPVRPQAPEAPPPPLRDPFDLAVGSVERSPQVAAHAGLDECSEERARVVVADTGRVDITFGNQANAANLAGGVLTLSPGLNANNDVVWVCGTRAAPAGLAVAPPAHATTVANKYLPNDCRA